MSSFLVDRPHNVFQMQAIQYNIPGDAAELPHIHNKEQLFAAATSTSTRTECYCVAYLCSPLQQFAHHLMLVREYLLDSLKALVHSKNWDCGTGTPGLLYFKGIVPHIGPQSNTIMPILLHPCVTSIGL